MAIKSLSGFRDFLPETMIPRQRIMDSARAVFERFGFVPLETPAMERVETIQGKYGEEGDKLVFYVQKRGQELRRSFNDLVTNFAEGSNLRELSDMAMRYDLTVPLSRVVAQYQDQIGLPFKRYQIAPVWRADSSQKGRFREFYQCDFDTVGTADMAADTEIVMLMDELMWKLGFENFTIRINNRKILDGICEQCGIDQDKWMDALRSLDKMEKIGPADVQNDLLASGVTEKQAEGLVSFVSSPAGDLGTLERYLKDSQIGLEGIAELAQVMSYLGVCSSDNCVKVDLSVARGLAYYTGTVFETTLNDAPQFGSVMSGGRFDKLVGMFLGRDIPAVGASLGLDRLFSAMEELGLIKTEKRSTAKYMIATIGSENLDYALLVAKAIRARGINVSLYPGVGSLRTQLGFAASMGFEHVIIVGEDEKSHGEITVRDMSDRTQKRIRIPELV